MTLIETLQAWMERMPIGDAHAAALTATIAATVVATLAVAAFLISRRIANHTIPRFFQFSGNRWGRVLVENNAFRHATLLVPAFVALFFIPIVLEGYPRIATVANRVLAVYLVGASLIFLDASVNGFHAIYRSRFTAANLCILPGQGVGQFRGGAVGYFRSSAGPFTGVRFADFSKPVRL